MPGFSFYLIFHFHRRKDSEACPLTLGHFLPRMSDEDNSVSTAQSAIDRNPNINNITPRLASRKNWFFFFFHSSDPTSVTLSVARQAGNVPPPTITTTSSRFLGKARESKNERVFSNIIISQISIEECETFYFSYLR